MKNNMRMLINVIEYLDLNPGKKAAFMLVDAEKALNNVSWKFLWKIVESIAMGDHFTRGIRAIYEKQKANLIINNEMTESVQIEKGTRQSCPLSPLLFIIVLEILTLDIRKDQGIQGTTLGGEIL